MRLGVQALASLSELRIWQCCGGGIGHSCSSDSIPGLGTFISCKDSPKKKKKLRKDLRNYLPIAHIKGGSFCSSDNSRFERQRPQLNGSHGNKSCQNPIPRPPSLEKTKENRAVNAASLPTFLARASHYPFLDKQEKDHFLSSRREKKRPTET